MQTTVLGFGVHRDLTWPQVPLDYLYWMTSINHRQQKRAQAEIERRSTSLRANSGTSTPTLDRVANVTIDPGAVDFKTGSVLRAWLKSRRQGERFHEWVTRTALMAELHGDRQPDGTLVLDSIAVSLQRLSASVRVTSFRSLVCTVAQATSSSTPASIRMTTDTPDEMTIHHE